MKLAGIFQDLEHLYNFQTISYGGHFVFLEVRNVKTTCRKLWPGILFQVLNLTFDPCYKVKSGHHTKKSLFLPFYWCYGFRM